MSVDGTEKVGRSVAVYLCEMLAALRSRQVLAWVYGRVVVSTWPRIRGYVALRFFGVMYKNLSYGAGPRCAGRMLITMDPGSSISIGERLLAVSDVKRAGIALYSPCKLRTMVGARLTIGHDVELNGTSITCRKRIDIGDGTIIAANVVIMDSDFHQQWPPDQRSNPAEPENDEPVLIGQQVWIGLGSTILKGSAIGDNTIIGAGSVVTGEIPANVVAAGNPARVIRNLGP